MTHQYYLLLLLFVLLSGCLRKTSTTDLSSDATLSECHLNTPITGPCKATTTGLIVTNITGSNITSYQNLSESTSLTASIPNGFYSQKSVTFTDSLLVSTNIKSGVTIFGVTGTYPGLPSNAHRNKGSTQLSSINESVTYASRNLPNIGSYAYRDIPLIAKDDDGTTGTNVTYVNRSSPIDWTGRTCGLSGSLEQRITDCSLQMGSAATWSGETNGNAGQAIWKLVTRTGDCTTTAPNRVCKEVWRDERTLLLWSSKISEGINWCMSSGSNNISGNPSAENDSSNYCNNASYQATVGTAVSACFEDGGTNFSNVDSTITNGNGKASLGQSSTPVVAWRLPTLYDYQLANSDGLRFVLPDAGSNASGATSTYEWTATVSSADRTKAWSFDSYTASVSLNSRNSATNLGVRCVGR